MAAPVFRPAPARLSTPGESFNARPRLRPPSPECCCRGLRPARGAELRAQSEAGRPSPDAASPARVREQPASPLPVAPAAPRRIAGTDPAISEVVARIHPVIIQSLDMAKIAGLDNETLATQLLSFLETSEAGVPDLSPLDRQRVVTQLVHDIKGSVPSSPCCSTPRSPTFSSTG